MKFWLYEVDLERENMKQINERDIVREPALVEAVLFNYMSQLEEVDEDAYVVVYKFKDDDVDCFQFTSYRTNCLAIEINEYEKNTDRFVRCISTCNDYSEFYESFFDVNIPYNKEFKLVKICNELFIEKIYY